MFVKSVPYLEYVIHAVVSAGILLLQLLILLRSDAPDLSVSGDFSSVGIAAALILLIYHVIQAIRARAKQDESDVNRILRNGLTGVLLSAEFAAIAFEREADTSTLKVGLAAILLSLICAMRLLDSFLDFEDPKEALSVQCVAPAWGPRVIASHLLMIGAVVAELINRVALDDKGRNYSQSAQNLETVGLMFLIVHTVLYPLNALIVMAGLDKPFITCLGYVTCWRNQFRDKCENGNGNVNFPRAALSEKKELVSLNRLPLIRHLVAGVILAANAYLIGASKSQANEMNFHIIATALYFAYDVVGRNAI